jgi:hypothetical protein
MDAAGRLWLIGGVAPQQQGYSGNAYFLDAWHGLFLIRLVQQLL